MRSTNALVKKSAVRDCRNCGKPIVLLRDGARGKWYAAEATPVSPSDPDFVWIDKFNFHLCIQRGQARVA